MQLGDLVRTTRDGIGVPSGSVCLIINLMTGSKGDPMAMIDIIGYKGFRRERPYLLRDLEVIKNNP